MMHHTGLGTEGREVCVMSHITLIFEGVFSYSKRACFFSACSTPSLVNYTTYV
jgi:hypothetical protein